MSFRIHILGPSGSGTTTLGAALAAHFNAPHLDTDFFYWKKTEIPFTEKHPPEHRLTAIRHAIQGHENWTLSGSLISWGTPLIPRFSHVIYLWVPWEIRKERLLKREIERYGEAALFPGGYMHEVHTHFIEWCERYDTAGPEQRSRYSHEQWLAALPASLSITRMERNLSKEELFHEALAHIVHKIQKH